MSRKLYFVSLYPFLNDYSVTSNILVKNMKEQSSHLKTVNALISGIDAKRNEAIKQQGITYRESAILYPYTDENGNNLLERRDAIVSKYKPVIDENKGIMDKLFTDIPVSLYFSYKAMIENFSEKAGRQETAKTGIIEYSKFTVELANWLDTRKVSYLNNDKAVAKFVQAVKVVIGSKVKLDGNNKVVASFTKKQFTELLLVGIIQYGERLKYWTRNTDGTLVLNDKQEQAMQEQEQEQAIKEQEQAQKAKEQARAKEESLLYYKHMQIAYTAHLYTQYSKRLAYAGTSYRYRRLTAGTPSKGRQAGVARFSK